MGEEIDIHIRVLFNRELKEHDRLDEWITRQLLLYELGKNFISKHNPESFAADVTKNGLTKC